MNRKWYCTMTFLIDERVSCVIMCNNPLVNQESHCTASFCGWWFLFSFLRKWLEWSKLWGRRTFKRRRRSHPSGGMQVMWDFINPLNPTKRCFEKSIIQRYECQIHVLVKIQSTKMYYITVNCIHVKDMWNTCIYCVCTGLMKWNPKKGMRWHPKPIPCNTIVVQGQGERRH